MQGATLQAVSPAPAGGECPQGRCNMSLSRTSQGDKAAGRSHECCCPTCRLSCGRVMWRPGFWASRTVCLLIKGLCVEWEIEWGLYKRH